jgi:hypothetical protein
MLVYYYLLMTRLAMSLSKNVLLEVDSLTGKIIDGGVVVRDSRITNICE